jgi:hypothetical protein
MRIPKQPLAEVEAELGRPCPHERSVPDYCRRCANNAAGRRMEARRQAVLAVPIRQPKSLCLHPATPEETKP